MKLWILVGVASLLCGCCCNSCCDAPCEPCCPPPAPVESDLAATEMTYLLQNLSYGLARDNHIHLEHGVSYFDDDKIIGMRLEFVSQDIIELPQARRALVGIVEGMLASLNQDNEISSQFASYPMTADNLEVYINYESFYGIFVDPFYISWIRLVDGVVTYFYFDVKDRDDNCWHWKKEFYRTSRELVVYEESAKLRYEREHSLSEMTSIFGKDRYLPE